MAEGIKQALGGKGGKKLHTHSVHYERAANGGFHAHVARHTSDGAHHHTEHHVLLSPEDAVAHLQEHLGNQPAAGEGEPPEEAPEMAASGADAGGTPGGGGAPALGAGM